VADTGCGMSPEVLAKVFEPFYTTKGMVGTGLGLWVSKDIVDRHRGSLKIRSSQRDGQTGTVIQLFLPFED
jgi:signal transduction histidine kinase